MRRELYDLFDVIFGMFNCYCFGFKVNVCMLMKLFEYCEMFKICRKEVEECDYCVIFLV